VFEADEMNLLLPEPIKFEALLPLISLFEVKGGLSLRESLLVSRDALTSSIVLRSLVVSVQMMTVGIDPGAVTDDYTVLDTGFVGSARMKKEIILLLSTLLSFPVSDTRLSLFT
jgi:hypothetical protein